MSASVLAAQHLDALKVHLRQTAYIDRGWLERWRHDGHSILHALVESGGDPKLQSRLARAMDSGAARRIRKHNAQYLSQCLETHRTWFDHVESHPLTERQREVIVRQEPNLLVLAGAGSGKTSTVVGHVGYLLHTKQASPEEILLLAYNRKAAKELSQRIQTRLGVRVDAWTFHGLGRHIITAVDGRAPTLSDGATNPTALMRQLRQIVDDLFDAHYRDMARYFLFYQRPYRPPHWFSSRAEYQRYLGAYDVRTFQGERVHSAEACIIANWLFCNGVSYIYRPVHWRGARHRPDFWLPDDDVIIDIAVIDEHGQVPCFVDAEAYQTRRQTAAAETRRVEVSSADLMANRLATTLRRHLQGLGVSLTPIAAKELHAVLDQRRDIDQLVTLLGTVLHHARSGGLTHAMLRQSAQTATDHHRCAAFVNVFEAVRRRYEQHLHTQGCRDFDDLIGQAYRYAASNQFRSPYRFFVVDEFQDISRGRLQLLCALLAQQPMRRLLCVGDDWQSIYRFAGSDISLLRGLGAHVGVVAQTSLDQTFRFSEGLADLSSFFVTRNPAQLPKTVRARPSTGPAAVIIAEQDTADGALNEALNCIAVEAKGEKTSVLLLGRYRFLEPDLLDINEQWPLLDVQFMTVHASKGLEADHVVVLGLVSGRLGFPTEVCDDPLLDVVLGAPEGCPNAEERRLFYVALTRARHRVYLLTDRQRPSVFVEELCSADYSEWVERRFGEG